MHNNRIRLAERRAALVAKAASQRAELSEAFAPLHRPLALADKGLFAVQYIAQHPVLLTGAVALAAAVRRKRWFLVLESGWLVWRMAIAARRKLES